MTAATETRPDIDEERALWLEWRRQGLGASDIAAVLGLSPWASPWSLWAEKTGLTGDNWTDSEDLEFGRRAELMIGPWFEDRTGLTLGCAQERIEHTEHTWARATLDGRVFDGPNWTDPADCLGGAEIKTDRLSARWEQVPAHYQAQGQWQMFTAGLERVWFPVLHGRRLEIYELERDEADIAMMFDRAREFWFDHVVAGTPPPVDGSDATLTALAEVYPTHTPDTSADVPADAVAELVAAKAEKKTAEAREKTAKARLAEALGDAEEGLVAGRRAVTYRTQSRAGVDLTRLRNDHPDLVAQYDTTTEFRVMRPTKEATSS